MAKCGEQEGNGRRPGLVVQKYGVSAGDVRGMQSAWRRIKREVDAGQKVVAVISAMGPDTDRLVSLAIRLRGRMPRPDPRELDMLMASGEVTTAPLVAIGLQGLGVPAIAFSGMQAGIRTSADYGHAEITDVRPYRVQQALEEGKVAVVAGFQGATDDLEVTTLGRAGGDTTAVRLAAALHADVCEIYVNHDGIRTADPYIVPESRVISHVSYDEALELAATGLHSSQPRAVEIARLYGVPVHLRPATRPGGGTQIVGEVPPERRRQVCAIAHEVGIAQIRVAHLPNRPGAAADVLQPLAAHGISANVCSTVDDQMAFIVRETDLDEAMRAVEPAVRALGASAAGVLDLVKISAVGIGMRGETGVAARMFRTLAEIGGNIETIASQDIRITCTVQRQAHERAIRALHAAFDLGRV